jgi:hypothetical protein
VSIALKLPLLDGCCLSEGSSQTMKDEEEYSLFALLLLCHFDTSAFRGLRLQGNRVESKSIGMSAMVGYIPATPCSFGRFCGISLPYGKLLSPGDLAYDVAGPLKR